MHAGRRYDAFVTRKAKPPLPPLLVCVPCSALEQHAPRLRQHIELLTRAVSAGKALPAYVPLGASRTGERLVQCDPSGAPQSATLLPIAAMWRALFGSAPVPLWLGYTPGAVFACSRKAVLRPRGEESAAAFYRRVLSASGLDHEGCPDPVTRGRALSRLWKYLLADEE